LLITDAVSYARSSLSFRDPEALEQFFDVLMPSVATDRKLVALDERAN
jgi:hypothetical protein